MVSETLIDQTEALTASQPIDPATSGVGDNQIVFHLTTSNLSEL